MGRNCIVTAEGMLYAAYRIGEDRLRVVKSLDNGFSWQVMHIFHDVYAREGDSGDGGTPLYLDYSEMDKALYILLLKSIAEGPQGGDVAVHVYNVTAIEAEGAKNETERQAAEAIGYIGYTVGMNVKAGEAFACAGHIDRKLLIAYPDADDGNTLKAMLVDINHYNSGSRDMTLDAGGVVDCVDVVGYGMGVIMGIFDVSEVEDGFWIWWVNASDGELYAKHVNALNTQEDFTSDETINPYNPTGDKVITEIFGCEDCCLFTLVDTVDPTGSRLSFYSVTRGVASTVTMKNNNYDLGKDGADQYDQYCWPQMVFINDAGVDKMQIFYMARDSGDGYNQIETKEIRISDGLNGTAMVATGSLASPWSQRNKCYCVFEPPNRSQIEIGSRGGILLAIGNGTGETFGHLSLNCSVYTEWLYTNAYAVSYTSTYISHTPADYVSGSNVGREYEETKRAFANYGIPLLVLKYELSTEPHIRSILGYQAPTEIELNGFLDELTLKNPSNIRLNESEVFTDVKEKDIRTLFFPAANYLSRTYKRTRRGFVMRTVYLLRFYGRFYEITQISPVFGRYGVIANKANLYVCGATYDPFTRVVLPNET